MRLEKRKRIIITVVILFIAMISATVLYAGVLSIIPLETKDYSSSNSGIDREITPTESIFANPIHIDGNEDWEAWPGQGTPSNPYRIMDLVIDASGSEYGILIENSNVYFTISCSVYNSGTGGAYAGIKLVNTINGELWNNQCYENEIGISLISSDNNTLLENDCYENKFGISLEDSHGNIVWGNTVRKNSIGINLRSSNDNILWDNTVTRNEFQGILLNSWCSHNTISKNTATFNWIGIYLTYSSNNKILVNTAYFNWIGIVVQYSNDNTLGGNTAVYNSGFGIRLIGGTNNNILELANLINIVGDSSTNNWEWAKAAGICTGSGIYDDPYVIQDLIIDAGGLGNGISIGNSYVFFRIENCIVYNCIQGIVLINSGTGTIINNDVWGNGIAIFLCRSDHNTISGNSVNFNSRGIELFDNCNENTFSENTVNYNDYVGINLNDDCDRNEILENTVNNNNNYGLRLDDECDFNTVSGNTIGFNGAYGIFLKNNCDYNTGTVNILISNTYLRDDTCDGNDFGIIYQ